MCERTDLELRVYLTGRPDGTIEWQVITVEDDGQTCWVDGDVAGWRAGKAVTPLTMMQCVSRALRAQCFELRARPQ